MLKKSALTAAVALGLGNGVAQANVYSMTFMNYAYSPVFDNTTVTGTVDTGAGSGSFNSGTKKFNGAHWTGTVIFGDETSGAGTWSFTTGSGASVTGSYTYSLAPGQVMMGILFDWSTVSGIPVLNIMNNDGSGVDIDSDGVLGTTMAFGPFFGAPVGFSGQLVPIPAAVWLFGSGLVGLVSIARRRKSA